MVGRNYRRLARQKTGLPHRHQLHGRRLPHHERRHPEADPNLPLGRQRRFAFQNSYLEVPAEVNFYQSLGERSAFYFMLGTAISINTTNRYDTIYYSSEKVISTSQQADSDDFRTVNYAFQTGIGWQYAFSERFMMVLTPTFKFWMRGVLKKKTTSTAISILSGSMQG
ncbi:MAG: outer membrane beta-barrel protein [Saprospiraceae bacterium]|nr:outer membrane beta-barrel protein [Saprospiraceae bacterium]